MVELIYLYQYHYMLETIENNIIFRTYAQSHFPQAFDLSIVYKGISQICIRYLSRDCAV